MRVSFAFILLFLLLSSFSYLLPLLPPDVLPLLSPITITAEAAAAAASATTRALQATLRHHWARDYSTKTRSELQGDSFNVKRYTSNATRQTSHVTRHTSHVTRHTSNVTRHTCSAAAISSRLSSLSWMLSPSTSLPSHASTPPSNRISVMFSTCRHPSCFKLFLFRGAHS